MLCAEEATQLAELWVKENPELPLACRLRVKRYRPSRRYRDYLVLWDVPELDTVMQLMRIAVHDDASIVIQYDHRPYIKKLSTIGFIRERRLFSVLTQPHNAPDWFVGVRRSDIGEDMQGIDGFADIAQQSSLTTLEIPFQIKSSYEGAEMHFDKYANHRGAVALILVKDRFTDDELRQQFYEKIAVLRHTYLDGRLRLNRSSFKAAS